MDIFAGIKESFSDELCKAEFKENSFEVLINNWKGRNFKFACSFWFLLLLPSVETDFGPPAI